MQPARSLGIGQLQIEQHQIQVGVPFKLRQRLGDVAGLEQLQLREAVGDQQCEPFAVEGVISTSSNFIRENRNLSE